MHSATSWATTTFGAAAEYFDADLLDAVRTATLLIMAGIRPGGRAAGNALRRVARRIPVTVAAGGLGRLVRAQRSYWSRSG